MHGFVLLRHHATAGPSHNAGTHLDLPMENVLEKLALEDFEDWALGKGSLVAQYKVDGLACSLVVDENLRGLSPYLFAPPSAE